MIFRPNFCKPRFHFQPPIETNFMMGVNMSVAANKMSFESPIGDVGNTAVDTFIMSSPGLVGPEGEEWSVKFNIRFPNWKWCGDVGSNCRHGEDGDLSAGCVTVWILGQSGKFRMFSTAAGENNTNAVTIEMDFFARTRCRLQCCWFQRTRTIFCPNFCKPRFHFQSH